MTSTPLHIGLIGCGTVGCGVVELLSDAENRCAQQLGRPIQIDQILVRDLNADRPASIDRDLLTDDPEVFFNNDQIEIIIEVAGGIDPISAYIQRALTAGRHVITANKALLAQQGAELFAIARQHKVCLGIEASCGGGVPMVNALLFGLATNRFERLCGIFNGTSNYILTQMSQQDATYTDALAAAQAAGFAEADPTLDVGGGDASQKLAILSSIAFNAQLHQTDVHYQGIDQVDQKEITIAKQLGYTIKPLSIGQRSSQGISLETRPYLVPNTHQIAQVDQAFNVLHVTGDAIGETWLVGPGAGQMPSAAAILSDLVHIASGWYGHAFDRLALWPDQAPIAPLIPADKIAHPTYLRWSIPTEALDSSVEALIDQSQRSNLSFRLSPRPIETSDPLCIDLVAMFDATELSKLSVLTEALLSTGRTDDALVLLPVFD